MKHIKKLKVPYHIHHSVFTTVLRYIGLQYLIKYWFPDQIKPKIHFRGEDNQVFFFKCALKKIDF